VRPPWLAIAVLAAIVVGVVVAAWVFGIVAGG
jgi:hypothetical protein